MIRSSTSSVSRAASRRMTMAPSAAVIAVPSMLSAPSAAGQMRCYSSSSASSSSAAASPLSFASSSSGVAYADSFARRSGGGALRDVPLSAESVMNAAPQTTFARVTKIRGVPVASANTAAAHTASASHAEMNSTSNSSNSRHQHPHRTAPLSTNNSSSAQSALTLHTTKRHFLHQTAVAASSSGAAYADSFGAGDAQRAVVEDYHGDAAVLDTESHHAKLGRRSTAASTATAAAPAAAQSFFGGGEHQNDGIAMVNGNGSNANGTTITVTVEDQREAANKVWGSLHATPSHLSSPATGSAGTARITHNLNHGNCRWQASCVEVRPKVKDDETDESKINPVIAKRNKEFGQQMPWEKLAKENKTKFPKSDKFAADDNVEIVFYFETHGDDGMGLKGYQNIAARVADGDLPGECANLTAVGGFATWTVPRSEFVYMTESRPMLGDMLSEAPLKRDLDKKKNAAVAADDTISGSDGNNCCDAASEEADLRRVTIRMSTASERANTTQFAEAKIV